MEDIYQNFKCIVPITIERFHLKIGGVYEINKRRSLLKLTESIDIRLTIKELNCFEKL